MPSNPYVDEMKAIKWLDNTLTKKLKNIPDGIHLNEIIRQTKLLFPVSKNFVIKWIQESYIELNYVKMENKILFYCEVK